MKKILIYLSLIVIFAAGLVMNVIAAPTTTGGPDVTESTAPPTSGSTESTPTSGPRPTTGTPDPNATPTPSTPTPTPTEECRRETTNLKVNREVLICRLEDKVTRFYIYLRDKDTDKDVTCDMDRNTEYQKIVDQLNGNGIVNTPLSIGYFSFVFTKEAIVSDDGEISYKCTITSAGFTPSGHPTSTSIIKEDLKALVATPTPTPEYVMGCDLIPTDLKNWMNTVLNIVKYLCLALVIILGVMDFLKAVASHNDDALKKSGKTFMIRVVAVVILFLLPVIIELILDLAAIPGVTVDPLCGIGK